MRILLLGNYLPDRQESMLRFANVLQSGLTQLGHEVRIIQPEAVFGKLRSTEGGLGKWLGYIDKFILFPRSLRRAVQWADVVHICDHSNSIYIKYLQDIPHVITCEDLLAIRSALGEIQENPTKWTGRQLQRMILHGLERSQRIACISEQTAKELTRIAKISPKIVSVVYMGLNYPYAPMEKAEATERLNCLKVSSSVPFLLHVGGNHWYKNRLGVLKIFNYLRQQPALLNLKLVMVGKPFTEQMLQFIQAHNLAAQVTELVSVDNEDLRALYSTATALLFPSLQEGFGWPIAEAQTCGCPVFTSNRAPMTEVGGDAAIYINPDRPEDAAREIAKQLPSVSNLKQIGLNNVQRFTTQKMLESYIQIYQEICP